MDTIKPTAVLVVDDRPDVAGLVRVTLRNLGMPDVETVTDGRRALWQLQQRTFGLAIIDIVMTPMSGIELISAIRENKKTNRLPIIAMSGAGDTRLVLNAKAAGADAFVLKPFSTGALKSKVAALLGRA